MKVRVTDENGRIIGRKQRDWKLFFEFVLCILLGFGAALLISM